jgi:hypothetical protein
MNDRRPWLYALLAGVIGAMFVVCLLAVGGAGYWVLNRATVEAESAHASPTAHIETRTVVATHTPPPPANTPLPSRSATPTGTTERGANTPSAATKSPTVPPIPVPQASPTPAPTVVSYPGGLEAHAASLVPAERLVLSQLDDPSSYTLDVKVIWDRAMLEAREHVLFTNNETVALEELVFRLYPNAPHYQEGHLDIEAVWVNATQAEFSLELDDTVLRVHLPTSLLPEAQAEVTIDFTVVVPRRQDRFGVSQDVMALGHWYPMLAVYDDEGWHTDPYVPIGDAFYSETAHYTLNLTLPEGIIVAATGIETGRQRNDDGTVTLTLVSAASRDFALALSPDFETANTIVEGTTITSFHLPGDETGAQDLLEVGAASVRVYNERFGLYPYAELDVVETHFLVDGSPGGMEFPGIVFISSEFYEPDSLYTLLDLPAVIVAHEVAHQWWYAVVGNDQVDDPWLDEAFAVYASILYFEEEKSKEDASLQLMTQCTLPYQMAAIVGSDRPVASSLLDFGSDSMTYAAIVYGKGCLFLHELRQTLGDERFFDLMQRLYQDHKYGIVRPDDFRSAMLRAAGDADRTAVANLYETWVLSAEGAIGDQGDLGDLDGLLELLEQLLEGQ